jgi:hypothetical protein
MDVAIILDNQGDGNYMQSAREFLTSPIMTDLLKIILSTPAQLSNIVYIKNDSSLGYHHNRTISIGSFVSAKGSTNLIIDVPLDPPVILNGKTYFQTDVAANSEIDLMFYYDQAEISDLLE